MSYFFVANSLKNSNGIAIATLLVKYHNGNFKCKARIEND